MVMCKYHDVLCKFKLTMNQMIGKGGERKMRRDERRLNEICGGKMRGHEEMT